MGANTQHRKQTGRHGEQKWEKQTNCEEKTDKMVSQKYLEK